MARSGAAPLGLSLAASLAATASLPAQQTGDVVFVATPIEIVIGMLNLAGVSDRDVVYDLGSGDGRIVIAAAKHYRARAVGIEIDSNLVEESRRSADTAGVTHLVRFERGNLFKADLGDATVVTLYLGRMLNERLRPRLLRDLRPGSRVVSQNFDMGEWAPDSVVIVRGRNFGETPVHLWIVPANVAGRWSVTVGGESGTPTTFPLTLVQRYQEITGTPQVRGRLRGSAIVFTLERGGMEMRLTGSVKGDSAWGTMTTATGTRLPWEGRRSRVTSPSTR